MLEIQRMSGLAGSTETIQLQRRSSTGAYVADSGTYTGDESLTCVVWPGEDRAASATLPASWNDGPTGKISIEFPLDVMGDLAIGRYQGVVQLADSSTLLAAFALVVVAGPGSAEAPKVYGTYQDLLDELPWLTQLQSDANDQTGFADARREARNWLDGVILSAVPTCERYFRSWDRGWDWSFGNSAETNVEIADALADDKLMTASPSGLRLVRAATYRALSTILRRCAGQKAAGDLMSLSSYYRGLSESTVVCCVAEIDTDGDGRPNYVVRLGRTSTK